MTPIWLVVLVTAQALAWLASPPSSLAGAAEREALRREAVGPSVGFYSNDTLEAGAIPPVESVILQPAESVTTPEGETRSASWWRKQVADRRTAITRDEKQALGLESEIARLDGEAISRDDPAQQALLRRQAIDARQRLEKLQSSTNAARRDLQQFLEEARRLNIPPGWVR